MSKTQFTIVAAFLTIIVLGISVIVYRDNDVVAKNLELEVAKLKLEAYKLKAEIPGDNCSICDRDLVTAHGGILLKNTTPREVEIRVRHHPDVSELVVRLDPNGLKMIDNVLVGTMKLRALGEGFDEESFCTITPNTQHEMWWRRTGFEMHGTTAMHMGH